MEARPLRKAVIRKIEYDGILFGKVANALDIKPVSLTYLIRNNSIKLTQISVITVLKEHLGVTEDNDLLQDFPKKPKNPIAA